MSTRKLFTNMRIVLLNTLFFLFLMGSALLAEVIILKSGDKVNGTIVQQNDDYVTIERPGDEPLVLSVKEIQEVDVPKVVVEAEERSVYDFEPVQTHYGIKYDLSPLAPNFEPTALINAITNINLEIDPDIDGVVVLNTPNTDMARIVKTASYQKDNLPVEESKYVIFMSPDMARQPDQIIRILKKEKKKTPEQVEQERIAMIKRGEITAVFNGGVKSNSTQDVIASQLAKSPGKFIELVSDMIDGKFRKKPGIEIDDYYLSFDQLFIQDLDPNSKKTIPIDGKFIDKQYYPNGKLSAEYSYLNGALSGISKQYYEDGELNAELNYENNVLNGKSIFYFGDGKVSKEVDYVDGKEDGVYKEYFSNGRLHLEIKYAQGKRDEYFREYFQNGQLKYAESYLNGKLHGTSKEYYPDGKLKFEMQYKNGVLEGEARDYFESGKIKYISNYTNGKRTGNFNEYYESGTIKYIENYLNGVVNGKVEEYYENGNIKFEFYYVNGAPQDIAKEYYPSGKQRFVTEYRNGLKNGSATEYYETGEIKGEYNYQNDELNGIFKNYFQNGKIQLEGSYAGGKLLYKKEFDEKGKEILIKD